MSGYKGDVKAFFRQRRSPNFVTNKYAALVSPTAANTLSTSTPIWLNLASSIVWEFFWRVSSVVRIMQGWWTWNKRHHWWSKVTLRKVGSARNQCLCHSCTRAMPDTNINGCCNDRPHAQYNWSYSGWDGYGQSCTLLGCETHRRPCVYTGERWESTGWCTPSPLERSSQRIVYTGGTWAKASDQVHVALSLSLQSAVPIVLVCLSMTVLLLCSKMDGQNTNIWQRQNNITSVSCKLLAD